MVGPFQDPENAHGQSRDGPNCENAHNNSIGQKYIISGRLTGNRFFVSVGPPLVIATSRAGRAGF